MIECSCNQLNKWTENKQSLLSSSSKKYFNSCNNLIWIKMQPFFFQLLKFIAPYWIWPNQSSERYSNCHLSSVIQVFRSWSILGGQSFSTYFIDSLNRSRLPERYRIPLKNDLTRNFYTLECWEDRKKSITWKLNVTDSLVIFIPLIN